MSTNNFKMVAKTFQGLEDVLRDELIALGAENVELGNRMVSFEGDLAMLYKANLCCRTALRILKPIVMFTSDSPDELYDKVRELPWEQYLNPDSTFSIDSTVYGEDFTHSKFVTYRVKDGIVDHFMDMTGQRPSIRLEGADLIFNVHIAGNRVTISLDSSGEPLYKRGYRVESTAAPINEVLAAGIILKTGWQGDTDFLDPMCGSGTFLIEAALIAANINPGIYRESFAFEKWKDFDSDLFEEIYNDDSEERDFNYKIFGGDIDPEAIAIARKNIKSAKVDEMIELSCQPLTEWMADTPEGIIVTNPPYGERLRPGNIDMVYKEIGSTLKNNFQGWHAWILGYQEEQLKEIGLKPSVKIPLHNGSLECSLREYVMFDGSYSDFRAEGGSVESKASAKMKSEGPRKVRHISDDDWKKESKKFNKDNSFADKKKKDKRPSSKPFIPDSDNDDDSFDTPSSFSQERSFEKNRNFKPSRGFGNDRKPQRESGFNKPRNNDRNFDRNSGRDQGRKTDNRFGNKNYDKVRSNDSRPGRDDRFRNNRTREDRMRGDSVKYDPSKSRGPRLPESSAHVINPVHLRKRKNRGEYEDSED